MKRIYIFLLLLLLLTACGSKDINTNTENMAETSMTDSNLTSEPVTEQQSAVYPAEDLIIEKKPDIYTYDDLEHDILTLQKNYGDLIQVVQVCETYDGRNVYDIVFGELNSENQIMIMGAMHAREYITSQVVMKQLCDVLKNYTEKEYRGISADELLAGTAVHFIPMVNPDGVTISQLGIDGLLNDYTKQTVQNICVSNNFSDCEQWKANAEGTDINRNFDAGWEEYTDGVGQPAPDHYKGASIGSCEEADGLIRLTYNYNFKRTVSYHTKGSLIYWFYKQTGDVLEQSRRFAQRISDVTGYYLDSDYTAVDAAGYKDWAVYKMGIPSITIEVGGEAPDNPVPITYFDSIWEKNKDVVWETLYDLRY